MISPPQDHPEASMAAAAMANEAEKMVAVAEAGGERKRKKTLGRQKIEIKRIKCPSATHVCFSKRRNGLYKKAAELCVLTGARLAIVVFSPAEKPYSIGHTSVNAVLEGYLDPASYVPPTAAEAAALSAVAREYECERERLDDALEAEKRRRDALDAAERAAGVWTGDDVRRKGVPELVSMLAALERVQAEANMMRRAHEVIAEEAIMMQQCTAAAAGAGDAATGAFQIEYPSAGAGAFMADDGVGGAGGGSYYHQEAMDTQMMLMGGNVVGHGAHAPLPFAPMLLPPDLPPQQPHFNYGSDHYNIAGYAGYGYGYGYNLVDGSDHGAGAAAYEMEGYYGTRTTTTTCNFFG